MFKSIKTTVGTAVQPNGCELHGFEDFRIIPGGHRPGLFVRRCFVCKRLHNQRTREVKRGSDRKILEIQRVYMLTFECGHENVFVEPQPKVEAYCGFCSDWKKIATTRKSKRKVR